MLPRQHRQLTRVQILCKENFKQRSLHWCVSVYGVEMSI
jgi:hypothetical protein